MTDFVVANPTEGLDASARAAPYVPSSTGAFTGAAFMSGLMNPTVAPAARALTEQQEESGFDNLGAAMDPTGFAGIQGETFKPQAPLAPKDLEAKFPGVQFDSPMTLDVAKDYAKSRTDQATRDAVMARYPSGATKFVLGLGAGAVSQLLDPVADAAFMVPVIGEARYGTWLMRAGETAGVAGRAGVTLGVGAARAEAGQTLLSAGRYATDPDYHFGDAANDLLTAPLAGAILHGAFAFRGDILGARFAESPEGAEAAASAATHDAAMRTAAAQMANGDPVEVRPVFDAARTRGELRGSTALGGSVALPDSADGGDAAGRAAEPPGGAEASARLDNAVARAGGAPGPEEIEQQHALDLARTEPDIAADTAEAERQVEAMRAAGTLRPEDEAELRAFEPEPAARSGAGAEPSATGGESAAPAPRAAIEAARDHIAMAAEAPAERKGILHAIKQLGGIKVRDGSGELTPDGKEVNEVLKDVRRPGVINNKGGQPLDRMREVLREQGWFGPREDSGADRDAILAAMAHEAAGGKFEHPEDADGGQSARETVKTEMHEAGIQPRDVPDVKAEKLARYRIARDTALERDGENWRQRADMAGVEYGSDWSDEDVQAAVIEREAMQAENEPQLDALELDMDRTLKLRYPHIWKEMADAGAAEDIPFDTESGTFADSAGGGGTAGPGDSGAFGLEPDGERAGRNRGAAPDAQLGLPGTDRSAKQLAAARESAGRGRAASDVEQRAADEGLFAPSKSTEPELFANPKGWDLVEPSDTADSRANIKGETLAGVPFGSLSDTESAVKSRVDDIVRQIAPEAPVTGVRSLRSGGFARYGALYNDGARRAIVWSLESPDAQHTISHELVHYLRHTGLISGPEWSAMEDAARAGNWIDKHGIESRYFGTTDAVKIEESIAEEFADWRGGKDVPKGILATVFARVQDFLSRTASALRQMFGYDLKPEDVFQRIASGEVGNRDPVGTNGFGADMYQVPTSEEMDRATAARKKLDAYQNLIKRQSIMDKLDDFRTKGLPLEKGLRAMMRGVASQIPDTMDSTAKDQNSSENFLLGLLIRNLEKNGLLEAWRSHSETANWVRELAELNTKGGKPGISKSPVALKIAESVKAAQDVARDKLNRSGAWIGEYDGYVNRTSHNAIAIHKAGYEAWRDFELARLDQDKTFAGLLSPQEAQLPNAAQLKADRIEKFMHGTWDALSTGVHMSSQGGVGKSAAFNGPSNLGKKISSERVLHYKNADAWREHQEKFGDPVIERSVMNTLQRAGRDSALMTKWGTNPQSMFDDVTRRVREKYRGDHDELARFDRALPLTQEEFRHLTGEASRPENSLAYKIRGAVLASQDITKLKNVLFTHMSVFATKPFQLHYMGVGRFRAYSNVLSSFLTDKSPEGKQLLENLRANATGQSQHIMSGYEPIDGVPGKIAQLRQRIMRLGLLPYAIERQKNGMELEASNFLGQKVEQPFDALPKPTQRALKLYGLGEKEWDTLRQAPNHDELDGSTYLTPAAAGRVPDAAIDAYAADRIAKAGALDARQVDRIRFQARDDLAMKLAGFYNDMGDRSTVTPGIPERAFFTKYGGGKFLGPVLGQYKTWALAYMRQVLGQAVYGSSRPEAVKALVGVIATSMVAGFLRRTITDVLSGKNPRLPNGDPKNDAEIAFASLVSGGGLGILGDMILGQFEANSGTGRERAMKYIAQLAGPSIGDVADVGGLGFDYLDAAFAKNPKGAVQSANANSLRTLVDHLPFVNLFYVRTLADWLLLDRLQEMAKPGYLARYQQRVKTQNHQTFWLPPTHYLGH